MSPRILIAYSMASSHVQTTLDYLLALKRYSGFDAAYVHVTHDAVINFDIDDFDVIFQNYCARLCFDGFVSQSYREAMKRFRGLKILAVQDEYDHTNVLKAAIKDLGFHVVLTCVPQGSLEYVYPHDEFPDVEFLTVLTGYVPDDLAAMSRRFIPLAERPIVVGYRGRNISARYGRLGFEKCEIGRRMREICAMRGIRHDIAMDDASRIYGTAWFDFISSCRSMLGSESGSNVFDFDGSIENLYNEMAASRGRKVDYEEFSPLVAQREGEISSGQISPRVFECAALWTPLVLFRGRYSDLIEADAHYLPLEKDFSNVDGILASLEDIKALEAMTERAHRDLVASGRFGFRAYARFLQTLIERKFDELRLTPGLASTAWQPWNDGDRDDVFNEEPTDRPFGKARFDLIQSRHQISVLEPEMSRLSKVFDEATIAYLAETTRLTDVCKSEIERLWGGTAPATASVFAAQSSVEVGRHRLVHFTERCRERHARFESEWSELSKQLPRGANIDSTQHSIYRQRLALLESEIKNLGGEIDQLNRHGREVVAAAVGLLDTITRTSA